MQYTRGRKIVACCARATSERTIGTKCSRRAPSPAAITHRILHECAKLNCSAHVRVRACAKRRKKMASGRRRLARRFQSRNISAIEVWPLHCQFVAKYLLDIAPSYARQPLLQLDGQERHWRRPGGQPIALSRRAVAALTCPYVTSITHRAVLVNRA